MKKKNDIATETVNSKNNGKPISKKIIQTLNGSSKEELLHILRLMYTSRAMDHKVMNLLKQGKSYFHLPSAGHEATQIAFGKAMKPGHDWAYPYYRDMAFMLGLGVKLEEIFLHQLAKADDPMSGGRQMPCHWGSKEFNVPTQSSPTGTQFLQAVGTAMSNKKSNNKAVTYVSSGEGTTSEGEFHEAVNWASRDKIPIVFVIQNNKWAISVPVENQTAGKNASVSEMMSGYENLLRFNVDGTDYFTMRKTANDAFEYSRSGKGPVLVEANTIRLLSHSTSDDQSKYRPKESIENDLANDPLEKFVNQLVSENIITHDVFSELKLEINQHINEAADWALSKPDPDPSTISKYVFDESGKKDRLKYNECKNEGVPIVMVDAINHALHEEMQRNEMIHVFGEDVADGKGGVFTATKGLSTKFGDERVFNSPLAEASILGVAIGMAVTGKKPCVEIQFGDYIWPAFMQVRDELVMYRYRSNNKFEAPVVIRVAVGGYINGGLYHSQNIEAFFTHMPGLANCLSFKRC